MKNYAGAPVPEVGLSNTRISHAHSFQKNFPSKSSIRSSVSKPFEGQFLELVTYRNGEGLLRMAGDTNFPDMKKKKLKPRQKGQRIKPKGITQPQAAKLKKVARFYDYLIKSNDWVCKSVAMVTLSYGRDVPDHQTAKKHLHAFMERLRRYVYKKHGDDIDFHHMWCAELQEGKVLDDGSESYRMKNGAAIHFHIVCPYFIPKGWLNDAWNGVVGGKQRLLPNVKAVRKPGNYVAKYISKEGGKIEGRLTGSSYDSKQAVKPQKSHVYKNVSGKDAEHLMDELADRVNKAARLDKDHVSGRKSDLACTFRPDGGKYRMLWTSNVDLLMKQMSVLLGRSANLCRGSVAKVVADCSFIADHAICQQFASTEFAILDSASHEISFVT